MTDFLSLIDQQVFYFINQTLANPVLDRFFIIITDVKSWYIAYLILLGISYTKGGRIGKLAVGGTILLILATDQFSSSLLKNWIERIRPCNELPDVRTILGCTGSFSFPSSHAVNNFAAAVFFYRLFPRLKPVLLITASLVALSRPYLGIHYPSDIIGGALIGWGFGYIFSEGILYIDLKLREKINPSETDANKTH